MTLHQPDPYNPTASHIACTDETQYNVGRIRGLGMVSAPIEHAPTLSAAIRTLLDLSSVRECKWEKLRTAKHHFAAARLLTWALDQARAGTLRIDTLTWDTTAAPSAPEHTLPHLQRLHHMYAHLLGHILPQRWPAGAAFHIYPDEQDALRWQRLLTTPHITDITPSPSTTQPLIQLADLFAGLAVYSRDAYATYETWLGYPRHALPSAFSSSDQYRCRLLDDFFTTCKYAAVGVSLRTNRGLRTYDPARPICFWWADTTTQALPERPGKKRKPTQSQPALLDPPGPPML
ncbi:MAG: hypothetical protein OJF49_000672 [Ktedonobacterales bacterium]|jgi:hypothetical protein|nr:MAG: hypothetical protein OJF49_000672 [Ktedonobacterales bacterium]